MDGWIDRQDRIEEGGRERDKERDQERDIRRCEKTK